MSLRKLVDYAYTSFKTLAGTSYDAWDADRIFGCACARAMSIDQQYSVNTVFPVSFNASSDMRNASQEVVSIEEVRQPLLRAAHSSKEP